MKTAFAAILGLIAALAAAQASAEDVADFYKRQRISLIVGNGTGGGYDVYARVLARYMGNHIPGNPSIIVQNMPGAGGLRAANYIYNVAAKDGTVFGTFARNMPLMGLIKSNQNVQFDPMKFLWLGSSSSFANDAYLLIVRRDAKVKSVDEARRPGGPPIILGSTAEGASSDAVAILLRDWLGFNVKIIPGYRDSGVLFLAIERGEVDGRTVGLSAVRSNRPDWLRPNGLTRVLAVFGRASRHPDFPDAPTSRELARSAEDRNLIEILEIPYQLSRPFAAPPGVPPDRAKALQDAFLAAHKDPGYLADAEKLGIDVSPIGGQDILRLIDRIAKTPPDQLKRIEKLVTDGG
ncbi:MAG TPA: tripartite tricarboxylate transporter substrate-binding protein [Xanthobacteraceae bacterium]|jgi:tripartite-type tricarboxylate transporter receptor subunit TctC